MREPATAPGRRPESGSGCSRPAAARSPRLLVSCHWPLRRSGGGAATGSLAAGSVQVSDSGSLSKARVQKTGPRPARSTLHPAPPFGPATEAGSFPESHGAAPPGGPDDSLHDVPPPH